MFKTTDGGVNWISVNTGTSQHLKSIFFINENTIWAVGDSGVIIKSTDGGIIWSPQQSETILSLNDIYFVDENNGWCVGSGELGMNSVILHTTNGGLNWIPLNNITDTPLYAIYFISSNYGWIVGGTFSYLCSYCSIILHTTNGGINWTQQSSDTIDVMLDVYFRDSNNGWIVGRGNILRTTNGGVNWFTEIELSEFSDLRSISFIDFQIGWVVGYGLIHSQGSSSGYGLLLKTTDGGENWVEHFSGVGGLTSVFFTDYNNGWIVGGGGKILHTSNGGVVPVELTSFTAQAENQKVILNWTTATELNNNGFEIQRRVAESDFATVAFVKGEGTTTNQKEYSFVDKDLVDGKYFYRLKQVDYNGTYEYSDVIEVDVRSLNEYDLEQNFPNPFNPTTTIGYVLKEKTNAKLILLNAIGEEVAVLVNEEQDKGLHKIDFNANTLASGVYFYRLQAGDFVQTKKMLLLK